MGPSSHIKHSRYNNAWGNRPHYNEADAYKLAAANAKASHQHRRQLAAAAPTEAECLWSKS